MTRPETSRAFLILVVTSCLWTVRPTLAQQQFVDGPPGHQETLNGITLHACPVGYAMAGANVSKNKFTCQRVVPASEEAQVKSVLDGGTQGDLGRGNMHICPAGTYMRGLHSGQNQLLCSSAPSVQLERSFLDAEGHTQGNDMHMCPKRRGKQTIMTGIHESRNDFACAFP